MNKKEGDKKSAYFTIKTLEEGDKQRPKHCLGEIIVHLNTYEDIFSQFDPRPFDERALSDDFILELKKATRVKGGEPIHIAFILDGERRSLREEGLIRKRLANYFQRHKRMAQHELQEQKRKARIMLGVGAALLLIDTYVHGLNAHSFGKNLAIVITEPAGWFLTWTGFERLFTTTGSKKRELEFYQHIEDARITFQSY